MNLQTIVQRKEGLEFSHLDEAYLAIDAQAGYCYGLNSTAGTIWDMLETPTSVTDLCARLGREYAVDEADCARDTLALLSSLREAGIIQSLTDQESS